MRPGQHKADCGGFLGVVAWTVEQKSRRPEYADRCRELRQGVCDDTGDAWIGEGAREHAADGFTRKAATPPLRHDAVADLHLARRVGATLIAADANEPRAIIGRWRYFGHVVQAPFELVRMLREPSQCPSHGVGVVQLGRPTCRHVTSEKLA